ncbi:MAG TPA: hypothetical protein VG032_11205 [Acidimicrobiales bacterium]|jgi:short-subunit dehydrogenase|nr:hypothetical protein [Acidimicrobiales bacterium]
MSSSTDVRSETSPKSAAAMVMEMKLEVVVVPVSFLTIQAFRPGMKQRHHGNVITMSSAAARRPSSQASLAYASGQSWH